MHKIQLIEANITHSKIIWQWRNDLKSRMMFVNSDIISFQEHQKWFLTVLKDKNRKLYLGTISDLPFGVVRFDRLKSKMNSYTVSINISPNKRNLGLGKLLLSNGIKKIFDNYSDCKFIRSEIKVSNIPSIKLFNALGFKLLETKDNINVFQLFRSDF